MRRLLALAAGVTVAIAMGTVDTAAQDTKSIWRIGTLFSGSPATHGQYVNWFRDGLRDLGYVEKRDYVIEPQWAMGKRKRIKALAKKLASSGVQIIVVNGGTVTRAVAKATRKIPIVVGSARLGTYGLIASLARPGGNVTGSTNIAPDLAAKQLQLLKEAVPGMRRAAHLFTKNRGKIPEAVVETEAAGKAMDITIQRYALANLEDLERSLASIKTGEMDAILSSSSQVTFFHRKRLMQFARSINVPVSCGRIEMVRAGCLISYVPDRSHMMRRAAHFVEKIMKGAAPGNLPVERPTKFRLAVNLKTAKALGISLPPSIMLQATEVVE